MTGVLSKEPPAFHSYGPEHLAALAVIMVMCLGLLIFNKLLDGSKSRIIVRIIVPALIWFFQISLFTWNMATGQYDIRWTLPLSLCDICFILTAFALLFPGRILFEILYFLGIAGALQALFTPALNYGFPHLHYFNFFFGHGIVIWGALYMTAVLKFRPVPASILRAFLYLNVIGAAVWVFNSLTGSNYMFLMAKPPVPTLLDFMGPWPLYIIIGELLAFLIFGLLYLPFLVRNQSFSEAESKS